MPRSSSSALQSHWIWRAHRPTNYICSEIKQHIGTSNFSQRWELGFSPIWQELLLHQRRRLLAGKFQPNMKINNLGANLARVTGCMTISNSASYVILTPWSLALKIRWLYKASFLWNLSQLWANSRRRATQCRDDHAIRWPHSRGTPKDQFVPPTCMPNI